jgi:lysine 6-dehydrogenase
VKARGAKDGRVTIVVLGGAGAMGRITVRDLVETAPEGVDVVVADYNLALARKVVKESGKRARAVQVDVRNIAGTTRVLSAAFAVINCCRHDYNLGIMEAALRARVHYCDLGGLFHVARRQLKLDRRFRKADRLAILGIGAAPGISNVLARAAADGLTRVDEIHIMVGGVDRTPGREPSVLGTSYSLQTVLDEANMPAAVFSDGRFQFVEPMSGAEPVEFPPPVGVRRPGRTIHSEVATLPLTYANKGIREVSFRIAFSDELDSKLRFVHKLGMAGTDPVAVGRVKVVPRELLFTLMSRLPVPRPSNAPPDEYEVLRVVVRGKEGEEEVEEVLDCHTPGIKEWGLGVDVNTGCPPSIAVQLLLAGEITARGALPAETAVPVAPFLRELEVRGMTVQRSRKSIARHGSVEGP